MTIRFAPLLSALLAATLLVGSALPAASMPPPERLAVLRRGVNLTNWFRFPARADPTAIRAYLGDAAMDDLRTAGFTFVRLAVQPEFLAADPSRRDLLVEQIARLQRHGLAVVVELHPQAWHLETSAADRAALLATWRTLAPALRRLEPRLTFPEVLNEPVFPHDALGWERLQRAALTIIRAALPANTVVLTGNDWGSIAGLLALPGSSDPDVLYSFHFYDPAELTSLAAWRAGLDTAALSRLPFPVADPAACAAGPGATDAATEGVARFYCTRRWDRAAIDARIGAAADWARQHHAALLAGEFGATARLNRTARLGWLRGVRLACEQRGIGWALWGYDDAMGFEVPRPPGPRPRLDDGVLEALGLKSLGLVSGKPQAGSGPAGRDQPKRQRSVNGT